MLAISGSDDHSQAVESSRALLAGVVLVQDFALTNPRSLETGTQVPKTLDEFRNGRTVVGVGSVRSLAEAEAALASK